MDEYNFFDLHNVSYSEPSPERYLWQAVIEQALSDSKLIYDRISKKRRLSSAMRKMRDSLICEISDPWFDNVCHNANIDPGAVKAKISRLISYTI